MFRSSDDSALVYTTDDLVLFRESPFAAWMERLTLENPDHGITPDAEYQQAPNHTESLEDIAETLRAEGRNVVVLGDAADGTERATNTQAAMRGGADFIVNGYLTGGTLAATAGLLMRTSGFSDFGDYLYIPCEARPLDLRHSAFRLCVLADLLQAAQGQLPPQMLIISGGADLTPLQTEDHIYYYRAVKTRFLDAMADFRKHRMPDPAESTFFGRWSDCAAEVLKQRAQRDAAQDQSGEPDEQVQPEQPLIIEEIVVELPQVQAAGGASPSFYTPEHEQGLAPESPRLEEASAPTLAEQASMLQPGSYRPGRAPGHTPNLAAIAPLRAVDNERDKDGEQRDSSEEGEKGNVPEEAAATPTVQDAADPSNAVSTTEHEPPLQRRTSDSALENLEFIGSAPSSLMGPEPLIDVTASSGLAGADAPAAVLGERESFEPESPWPAPDQGRLRARSPLPDLDPPEPALLPPEPNLGEHSNDHLRKTHPLDSDVSDGQNAPASDSMIDMDGAPPPSLSPLTTVQSESGSAALQEGEQDGPPAESLSSFAERPGRHFSNSLQTGNDFEDSDEP